LGFQLSYLAVAGIVFLQKPIQSIVRTKNKILKMGIDMLSVTLAAQIATLPATLYYFHQFPTYFLFTNLVAVPLSTLILFLEIGVLGFSWIEPASIILGKITASLIRFMNYITEFFDTLPFSNIDYISFDIQEVLLCFGLVLSLLFLYLRKEKKYLFISVCWFCITTITIFYFDVKRNHQSLIIIPNQYSNQSLFFIKGRTALHMHGKTNHSDSIRLASIIKGIRTTYRIEKITKKITNKNGNFYFNLEGNSFLVLSNENIRWKDLRIKEVDFLLLTENPRVSVKEITEFVHPKQVIIAASNSKTNIMQWEKEINSLPLRCFSIANRGAFIK
jgi:competence protein ComEC